MLKVPDHQVAGHQARNGQLGPLIDDSGRFYKPLQDDDRGSKEVAFYSSFSSNTRVPDHIRRLFPVFHGTQLLEASDGSGLRPHLVLEDVVSTRSHPSVMDIKIGSRTWYPESSEDYIQRCFKKDRETSSLSLGFRISGLQIYGNEESGFWKPERKLVQNLSAADVRVVLKKFVSSDLPVDPNSDPDCSFAASVYGGSTGILAQLLELKAWFEDQTMYHLNSCSVLLVYEKEKLLIGERSDAEVKLIDFAHVTEGKGIIDHNFLGDGKDSLLGKKGVCIQGDDPWRLVVCASFWNKTNENCPSKLHLLYHMLLQATFKILRLNVTFRRTACFPVMARKVGIQENQINRGPIKSQGLRSRSSRRLDVMKRDSAKSISSIFPANLHWVGFSEFKRWGLSLNTLGLSIARTDLEIDGLMMPHSHPRASEMFFVSTGVVIAGFIDTQNKLFQKTLQPGEVFVFPQGLLHFCVNNGFNSAVVFSVLNSQNPGMVNIADAMLESDDDTLNKLLKIGYTPRGNFNLRDFHLAVNNVPTDSFLPEINDSGSLRSFDVKLSSILSDQVLYSWGGKDIMRKVIVLSSCVPDNIDNELKLTLMDAADKCVSVEFLLFEQSSSHLGNFQENINSFMRSISDLDNFSFGTYLADSRVFHSLVKRWLQELKDDMEEPLQARFIFKSNLTGSLNQIFCSLSTSVCQIIDGFSGCETCRCHGSVLDNRIKDKNVGASCPITGRDLEISDVIENSVQVGDKTVLFMPSFQSSMKLKQVSSPIDFNIIERANLSSLSEGLIIGSSYFVTPSACYEIETSDEMDRPELNAQIFQGICSVLHSMDQGLLCSSCCNLETMKEAAFDCYYLLQPSDNGPMLLRRLAGSEEVLPVPDANRFLDSPVNKEIQNSIQASLLKMELRDYNPVIHERGFHQKLNLLVKESLQFGPLTPKLDETTSELNSNEPDSSEVIVLDAIDLEDETPLLDLTNRGDKTTASIAEEWEQLVVKEVSKTFSPACVSKPKMDQSVLSSPDSNRQLDAKTSRILERLELPRQLKSKTVSPTIIKSQTPVPPKKPLIPFQPTNAINQSPTSSQLLKPNFQRLKRKHK
ncbi:hypothetical protein D5086_027302 [Populus alba]|uniref:Uncharacterized protein n=1 Tax=Populus alba TaxID=43335 RepID=A0ACC4AV19_POPAL